MNDPSASRRAARLPDRPFLEVRQLRLVAAVARHGSVTAAASELRLSQSALSHQLINLEATIGRQLFDRVGKRMVATHMGAALARAADDILRRVADAEHALRGTAADRRSLIRIAASCSTIYGWLGNQLAQFAPLASAVDVRIAYDVGHREIEAVLKGEIDVAITSLSVVDKRLDSRELFSLETVAVMAADAAVAGGHNKDRLRWSDLSGQTVLIHDLPDDDVRALTNAIGQRGATAHVSRVQLTEAIVELARARQGIGLLSRWQDDDQAPGSGLVERRLNPAHRRSFRAVWRAGTDDTALVSLVEHLSRASPAALALAS